VEQKARLYPHIVVVVGDLPSTERQFRYLKVCYSYNCTEGSGAMLCRQITPDAICDVDSKHPVKVARNGTTVQQGRRDTAGGRLLVRKSSHRSTCQWESCVTRCHCQTVTRTDLTLTDRSPTDEPSITFLTVIHRLTKNKFHTINQLTKITDRSAQSHVNRGITFPASKLTVQSPSCWSRQSMLFRFVLK